jgi:hypothetical protein
MRRRFVAESVPGVSGLGGLTRCRNTGQNTHFDWGGTRSNTGGGGGTISVNPGGGGGTGVGRGSGLPIGFQGSLLAVGGVGGGGSFGSRLHSSSVQTRTDPVKRSTTKTRPRSPTALYRPPQMNAPAITMAATASNVLQLASAFTQCLTLILADR